VRKWQPMSVRIVALAFLLLTACRSVEDSAGTAPAGPSARRSAFSTLRPLDDQHAAEFRQVFDEAKDRNRYVVALSPT